MFNFTDINRIVTSAVGAILLSALCVGAAVAPAQAVETAPIAAGAGLVSA